MILLCRYIFIGLVVSLIHLRALIVVAIVIALLIVEYVIVETALLFHFPFSLKSLVFVGIRIVLTLDEVVYRSVGYLILKVLL